MTSNEALDYCRKSLEELRRHMLDCQDDGSTRVELRTRKIPDDATHIQIWWTNVPSRTGSELLWDSLVLAAWPAENLAAFKNELERLAILLSQTLATADLLTKPTQAIPLFRYHPMRFRATSQLAKKAAQLTDGSGFTMFRDDVNRQLGQVLSQTSQGTVKTHPLRTKVKGDARIQMAQLQAALFYGDFVQRGRQIFDFPGELSESFRRSDVQNIPLSAIKLPYDSFYLYFGPQYDLETAPGWFPDGAYVSRLGKEGSEFEALQFCLTSVTRTQAEYEATAEALEPYYVQAVKSEELEKGFGEALDKEFNNKMAMLTMSLSGTDSSITKPLIDNLVKEGCDKDSLVDVSGRNSALELKRLPGQHKAWKEMLNLVVNAIAYLSSYKEDVQTVWPEKTPKDLLALLQSGTPKQKLRARSKLSALGFSAIHLCGKQFTELMEKARSRGGREENKKPAWVRGTWVWQPHGPKHSLRRLQWRMPHLRNKDEASTADELGHLYLVSQ